ncbi:zinc finger HIT domain-containing protein 3 [Hypanus sabinus]|uniref:zinc finger HIT domain-containing protein 3 n=1 Tax=Hypanus sabinus TaxID=79690 RepID=UPI0028C400F2|nr:zinc finger HIT domain-containing protein 3 [Hypanus sabinus]
MMKVCGVCEEQATKYRCPACDVRYCSVGCYKKHKDDCKPQKSGSVSSTSELSTEVGTITWQEGKDDILGEDEESDRVPLEKLKLLAKSEELKSLLCNPHLRQLLLTIDRAEDKENIMKSAMQEPIFVEFADRCLQVVEPQDKENDISGSW